MDKIGGYRSRIVIENKSYTANGFGGFVLTWENNCTVWAKIAPIAGKKAIEYRQVFPRATATIYMRYRSNISIDMRVKYNNRYFNILSVTDVNNMHNELILICEDDQSEQ